MTTTPTDPAAPAEPKISLRGVRKAFGAKKVLDGIDVDVPRGQSLVIIGGSGSGKSVLIKCVLGLIAPDAGSIKIDGMETVGISGGERTEVMRKFGMLFQGGALFDSLSVWENVAFGPIQSDGVAPAAAKEIALAKLAAVGLPPEVGELRPSELSGGMQKRVSLARAIAREPEIIFFDEPTTGLDPIMSDVINDLIVKCVRELGATTISITHDMHSARKIGDRIAMIYEGKLIWQGPVGDIDRSGNPYVEQFIHGSAEGPIKMAVRKG
ncbi:MAG: ABC transporter ATP-binding protein [Rhodospirillales bacterium]|nr:ABC transporter ATP-binding protein [Rhodospirillales bacterium]QQS12930.1 MAG: ABC transporter ATP-binding protein [Rhodospirillales bacterium]